MNRVLRFRPSRRSFIIGASAAVLSACSGGDDEAETGETAGTPDTTGAPEPDTTTGATAATEPASAPAATDTTTAATEPGDEPAEVDEPDDAIAALTPAMFESLAICALLPSAAEGPFPNPEELDRRDITEGYPGHPLRLGIRVVDAACAPIPGARVEIWHADATGDYSSYEDGGSGKDEGSESSFLRGIQTADADGIVEFQTIYPGWYEGRAVHIHATVHVDGDDVLTTQLYFDESYTESVMASGPYAEFGPPDTGWSDDGLIGDPATDGTGIALTAAPTPLGEGTLGLINAGVPS